MTGSPRRIISLIVYPITGKTVDQVKKDGDKLSMMKIGLNRKYRSPCLIHCPLLRQDLKPEDISAEILKKLIHHADIYLNGKKGRNQDYKPITKAVITVPAYFLPHQCNATEQAGYKAGLSKVKLLREPEAAALSYGLLKEEKQIVLVFDLGKGPLLGLDYDILVSLPGPSLWLLT
jgi:molecular chaperone DnaK (HSP70)